MSYTVRGSDRLFALIDVNNFYVSCERAFQPELLGRPVVVLSNNDGCAIARSQEAKDLGVSMGVPVFQIRDLIKKYGIVLRSSNYALYGDMSARFKQVLQEFSPSVEGYSIDECFIEITGSPSADPSVLAHRIKKEVAAQVHLPVCVGVGRTKTQAKLANHLAKKSTSAQGVFIIEPAMLAKLYPRIDVSEIWGMGRAGVAKLKEGGCKTISDFCRADERWVKKVFSIVGLRTQKELQGVSCLELEHFATTKKEIMVSRAFGKKVIRFDEMREAVATYAAKAVEKLWRQNLYAGSVTVFVRTDPFDTVGKQYCRSLTFNFETATNDPMEVTHGAIALLKKLYVAGVRFRKAGVMLQDLSDSANVQLSLFAKTNHAPNTMRDLFNEITQKQGAGSLSLASAISSTGEWRTKSEYLSNRYTTRWNELPVVSLK